MINLFQIVKPQKIFLKRKKGSFNSIKVLIYVVLLLALPAISSYGQSSLDSLLRGILKTSNFPMIGALSANAFDKRNDRPEEAIKLSLEAIEMSEKVKFVDGLIFNYRLLGNLYFQVYNYEEAIHSYDQCIKYSLPKNDSATIRECYLNQGAIYFTKGLNSMALDNFLLALKFSENLDKENEYNNLGAVFFNEQEYEEAYKYYNKALEILERKGNQHGILVANNNIGDVYKMMGKYDVALVYYNKVLSASDSIKNPELEIVCLSNIGAIKSILNDKDSAVYYFDKALKKSEDLNKQLLIVRSLALIGETLFEKGQFSKAKEHLERANVLATQLDVYEDMFSTSKLLQLIYEKEANYKKAYLYANIQKLASDSLSAYKAKEQVLKIMLNHKIRLQDLERQRLLENEKNEQKKSVFIYLLIILILIIIVLLGVLILFRNMQLRKIDRIMREKADLQLVKAEKAVDLKNAEIIDKVLKISEKNEVTDATVKALDEFSHSLPQKQRVKLEAITNNLRMKGTKSQWEEFFYYFSQVYSQFYEQLEKEFPNLTLTEKRLCALLKLNLTTKDMAAITNLNVKSVEVARTRLRKKLNLTNSNLTLQEFFSQL